MVETFVSGMIATVVFTLIVYILALKGKDFSVLGILTLMLVGMTVVAAVGMPTELRYETLVNNVTNVVLPQVELYTQEELDNLPYKDYAWVMENCCIRTNDGETVYVKAK